MAILALVRHGESNWNEQEKFSGWHDVLLTSEGEEEAKHAAEKLNDIKFDLAFSSELTRAKDTLQIILQQLHSLSIPTLAHNALNERDYGDLTGKTHEQVIAEYGQTQYEKWHRSWDIAPPHGESLKDTHRRVIEFFQEQILPELIKGKNVLVVSSGNTLRALRKDFDKILDDQISTLEIPTGTASLYEFKDKTIKKLT